MSNLKTQFFMCFSKQIHIPPKHYIYSLTAIHNQIHTHTRSHIIRHTCDWEKPPNHYSCWLLFSVPTTILRRRPSAPIVFFINFFLRFVFVFLVFANACLCVSVCDDQRSPAVIFSFCECKYQVGCWKLLVICNTRRI